MLAHVGVDDRLPLKLVAELAGNFFAREQLVIVVNRLEQISCGVTNRRVPNDSGRVAADNADVGRARADIDAQRARREVARLAVQLVEVISRRLALAPKIR